MKTLIYAGFGWAVLVGAIDLPCSIASPAESGHAPASRQLETKASPDTTEIARVRDLIARGLYPDAEAEARRLLNAPRTGLHTDSLNISRTLDLLVESMGRNGKVTSPEIREFGVRALRIKERYLGLGSKELVRSLNNLGNIYTANGDLVAAQQSFERGITIIERLLGPDDAALAEGLNGLAATLSQKGDYAGAKRNWERALVLREKTLGPDHPAVAQILGNLSSIFRKSGDLQGALRMSERALFILERARGPHHPTLTGALIAVANVYSRLGDYPKADSLYGRAIAIKGEGAESADLATLLHNAALIKKGSGDLFAAQQLNERARAMRERVLGPDHADVASSLMALAEILQETGNYDSSRVFYSRAAEVTQRALGPDHDNLAAIITSKAELCITEGRYSEAKPLIERALEINRKLWGQESPGVASALSSMGNLLEALGDYGGAERAHEQALSNFEKGKGFETQEVAAEVTNLANLKRKQGQNSTAAPMFDRALAIEEKLGGSSSSRYGRALHNIAMNAAAMGNTEKARTLFAKAVTILENSLYPDHPDVAGSLDALGNILNQSGHPDRAIDYHKRALAIRERALGHSHPLVAESLLGLAGDWFDKGEADSTFDAAIRAEDIGRDHLRSVSETLIERQALAYNSIRASGLNLLLSVASQPGRLEPVAAKALDAVIRSRSIVLDAMCSRHISVATSRDSVTRGLEESYAASRRQLANLVVRGPSSASKLYPAMLDSIRMETEKTGQLLAERSATFRNATSRAQVGLNTISAAMPRRSALLSYVKYRDRSTRPQYVAFVMLSGERAPHVVPLGDAADIDAAVARWYAQVGRQPVRSSLKLHLISYRNAGADLRKRIWEPVSTYIARSHRVFVVLDGALNLVNIASLPDGDTSFILESGPLIHYLSAERDLAKPMDTFTGSGLLAIGDPDFDVVAPDDQFAATQSFRPSLGLAGGVNSRDSTYRGPRSSCPDFQHLAFERLPGSAREVAEIPDLRGMKVGGERKQSSARDVSVRLTGAHATESAFKRGAPGKLVLHLATHGFFLAGECGDNRAPQGAATESAPAAPSITAENPLLLSGLALAGANKRESADRDREDGVLTADEVAAMNLSGVQWAVLSACETGTGKIRDGEGVFGLCRAFQLAGANTVIMSLWQVDDAAACDWMKVLYRARWKDRIETARAVRRASLQLMKRRTEWMHPFYWASFVAAGDWH